MATIAWSDASAPDHTTTVPRMSLRRWLRTTPGLLRLFSIIAVAGLLAVAVVGVTALLSRRDAIRSIQTGSGPQLTTASELYASLSAADAAASSLLLDPGQESAADSDRYRSELTESQRLLVDLSASSDLSPTAQDAARVLAEQVPTYSGRVARARTLVTAASDEPLASAYMRTASAEMRDEILPAATTIWRDAAVRLQDDYRAGTSRPALIAFAIVGGSTSLVLVGLAVFLAIRTRRLVNLGVVAAVLILLGGVILVVVLMLHQDDSLSRAQRDGSDPAQTLAAASFLALQAQADVNLSLVDRDSRPDYLDQFEAAITKVAGSDASLGLLRDAAQMAQRSIGVDDIDAARTAFQTYVEEAHSVGETYREKGLDLAVAQASRADSSGLTTKAALVNERLTASMQPFEQRFSEATDDASRGSTAAVALLAIALAIAAAGLLAGVQPRIGEYR